MAVINFGSNSINGAIISWNSKFISSGYIANSTTVENGGQMYINNGGVAYETSVNYSGHMYISNGGKANSTTVNYSGSMYISSGGTANSTTINSGGNMYISNGGTANSTTINSGGCMYISNGGTATEIKENGGYVYVASDANVTFVSNTINGLVLRSRGMTVHKNTIANEITARDSYIDIYDGGIVNSSFISACATIEIFSGGIANNTVLSGTKDYYLSHSSACMLISSGGIANDTIVDDYSGMSIRKGGVANKTIISGGECHISSDGTANSTTIQKYGSMYISSGGVANETTVNGGYMYISSGGVANETTVNGGLMLIYSGGTASIVFNPWQSKIQSSAGAVVKYLERDAKIYYGGNSSGLISKYNSISDLNVTAGNSAIIYSGGMANNTTVNSKGCICISSGGVADNTTVNSGGSMYISNGGVASDTTVDFGTMYITSDGKHTGILQITSGSVVSAEEGTTIDFTVADRTTADDYLINNLALIKGTPSYTITVSANQSEGTYKLAQGAENFAGTISIGDSLNNYGSITVNGADLVYGSNVYSLDEANGDLTLSISLLDTTPPDAPIANADIIAPTNQDVTVTAEFAEDSVLNEYSLDGNVWSTYTTGIKFTDKGIVYFRSKDEAGNYSAITEYQVTNIDKNAPTLEISGNAIDWTNQDVVLIASSSDGTIEYFNGTDWVVGDTITATENGIYQFRVTDLAGNVTEKSVIVDKIDKNATLTISGNAADWTNQDVVLIASSSDGIIEFWDGSAWVEGNSLTVSTNGTYTFRVTDLAGNMAEKSVIVDKIDKDVPGMPASFSETISGYNATLDWSAVDNGNAGINGFYIRYGTSAELSSEGEFVAANDFVLTNLAVGTYYYQVMTADKAGNNSEWSAVQTFEIVPGTVQNLQRDCEKLTWDAIAGVKNYIVEYSTDNFANVVSVETKTNKVDLFNLSSGTYQWRVKAYGGNFATGELLFSNAPAVSQKNISTANGNTDIFFVKTDAVWQYGYGAIHLGILNGWEGTGEVIFIDGKNIIADIFEGSDDANILVMTDDANGDALFVDDIYTALPGTVTEQQARIARIDEIRAGFGDDVVDLTSQQFAYAGDGVTVYGGLGNDIIWANNGSNILYGDAGNDRIVGGSDDDIIIGGSGNDSMHGGGGNDIFCFGENWGKDVVEQLDGGSVTLWFESDNGSWNEETCTYTDGVNSVTVYGASAVSFQFGANDSLPEGAFSDAASEKIFEDKNKGLLA